MAVTFVTSTTGSGASDPDTFAFNVTSTDNTILLVSIGLLNGAGQTVVGVTYAGVALTKIQDSDITPLNELWYLLAPTSGTNNVVIDWTGGHGNTGRYGAFLYSGVDQVTPLGTANRATATSITPSVDVTSATGEMVVYSMIAGIGTAPTYTADVSQTARLNQTGTGIRCAFDEEAGAATVTMSGTLSASVIWSAIGVSLKPVTSTGTNTQIQIGDAWKSIDAMQINIGDSWKAVAGAQINIGDTWKTIF